MKYSPEIRGAPGNYGWTVRYDRERGYLGITQTHGDDHDIRTSRVLLSPNQVKELVRFVMPRSRKAAN